MNKIDLTPFIIKHQLSESFIVHAKKWFIPLAQDIILHHRNATSPIVIGINGAQGSGKSTLADLLVYLFQQDQLKAVSLSLDDFYLTFQERAKLAEQVHPLFITRGAPGTHDIDLADGTIHQLLNNDDITRIPRFNKAADNRLPTSQWDSIIAPVDIIVLEGWCLGSEPQNKSALFQPINDLEQQQDPDGIWRHYANQQLHHYKQLFSLIDSWIMLKAPSFDCVFNWRLEQEQKLKMTVNGDIKTMSDAEIAHFIKHYQRITEHTLNTLPNKVNYMFELNEQREISQLVHKEHHHCCEANDSELLIFTDLDGSLLDHYSYSHSAADKMLEMLEEKSIPVIPISSKTKSELLHLRQSLNNAHPFIIENGAAVFIPIGYFNQQPYDTEEIGDFWVKKFVHIRHYWQSLITHIESVTNDKFITFSELSIEQISALTGLEKEAANRASRRLYGEPVAWKGSEEDKQKFIAELTDMGANVLEGGRFLHISGDTNKGSAMTWLLDEYKQQRNQQSLITLAIGDSPNDIAMLEVANIALVIRSPARKPPKLERQNNTYLSKLYGPEGWAQTVADILDDKNISLSK